MAHKDNASSGSKDELLKDLKSLKSTLDEDDDNVPLLLDESDDSMDDDNIPVLDSPELPDAAAADKASLEAALRQLESMELAPKSRRASPPPQGLEEKIRANAAPPIISHEELSRVRENPFLNSNQKAQLDANRKLREEAQQAAKAAASASKQGTSQKPPVSAGEEIIEFTDNPFLKASTSVASTQAMAPLTPSTLPAEEEDGSAEILKELGEDARPYQPRVAAKAAVTEKAPARTPDAEADGFGDIILDDTDAVPVKKPAPVPPAHKKLPEQDIDHIVDEIVEEYLVILEAALRKKLKEKLPDLLK